MWAVALTEIRRIMRSGRLLAVVAVCLALALLVVGVRAWVWSNDIQTGKYVRQGQTTPPPLGPVIVWYLLVYLIPFSLLVMPVFTADMVAGEREDGSLEMLELSQLRPKHLVLGKFIAAAISCYVLCLSTVPFLALADLGGGPPLWSSVIWLLVIALYCLPFVAVGISSSVRAPTRAIAVRRAFAVTAGSVIVAGVAAGIIAGVGAAIHESVTAAGGPQSGWFWIAHILTFPAGLTWTVGWQYLPPLVIGLGLPIAVTVHWLSDAWRSAAWLEPLRIMEAAGYRAHAGTLAYPAAHGPLPPSVAGRAAVVSDGSRPPPTTRRFTTADSVWARLTASLDNPIEIRSAASRRDAAWMLALGGWVLPLFVVALTAAMKPATVTDGRFLPVFTAVTAVVLLLVWVSLLAPATITTEREAHMFEAIWATNLGPEDIIVGKLRPRVMEPALMYAGLALAMIAFAVLGPLDWKGCALLLVAAAAWLFSYGGVGMLLSLALRRSLQSLLAMWGLLVGPMLLAACLSNAAGALGRWVLMPLSPILLALRCLSFEARPALTPSAFFVKWDEGVWIWLTSILLHVVLGVVAWWLCFRRFDRVLYETRSAA